MQSLGHPDEASQIYQRILERNPDSEESLSNLVLIGMSKEDFDMVREYSERLLELHPESTVALEGLAAWACAAGEHALTAKFCTLLVSAVPGHFEGWFNLALAHQKSGRWEQAAEAYEEAIKLRPQSCEAYTNLGIVREQLGDDAGARAAYDRAMQASPDALAPIWNVALLLEHSGQFEEAERWYKQVLEKAPKEEEARFRLGYLRLQREDYRGAAEAFEGCLKYRPQWPEAYANLALAYSGLGDRDRAERLYEKMLENDPKSMDALRGLAALAIQASRFRYRAGVSRAPDRPGRAFRRGALQHRPDVRKGGAARQGRPPVPRRAGAAARHARGAAQPGPHSGIQRQIRGSARLLEQSAGSRAGAGARLLRAVDGLGAIGIAQGAASVRSHRSKDAAADEGVPRRPCCAAWTPRPVSVFCEHRQAPPCRNQTGSYRGMKSRLYRETTIFWWNAGRAPGRPPASSIASRPVV